MTKWIKNSVYAIVIFVILWAIYGYFASKNAPLSVKTAKAQRQEIVTEITSNGKIQPTESYALNFTASGKITYLPYEEGDSIKKGSVIARLQADDVYQQAQKAQADYRLSIEKIREFEYNNKDKPKDDKYNLSKYQLEAQRDSAKATYEQNRSAQGNKLLVSPIDGIITQINAKAGEISSAATPVMTVANLDQLEFLAEIDEQDAGRLQIGQPTEISLDALGNSKIQGTIYDISQISKTNSTGGTYYPTKISLTETNSAIRTGMNGDATIQTAKIEDVIAVPSETIIEEDSGKYVYVIENGKAKKVPVTVGLENDTQSEIKSGLTEGAEVIIPESDTLKEGAKVQKTK